MSRSYPRWGGIVGLNQEFGRKVPLKYRACCVCNKTAVRVGTVQHGFSRSDDELFALCPDNTCRDRVKTDHEIPTTPGAYYA